MLEVDLLSILYILHTRTRKIYQLEDSAGQVTGDNILQVREPYMYVSEELKT